MTASPEGFPPQDLRSFLELCEGEWLALRSHFDLSLVQPDEAAAAAMEETLSAADSNDGEASASAAAMSSTGGSGDPAGSTGADASPDAFARVGDAQTSETQSSEASTSAAPGTRFDSSGIGDPETTATSNSDDGLPDFAALLRQARAEVEEAPIEEAWHRSERAELQVAFLPPLQADQPGGLRVTPPAGESRELHFRGDGSFAADPSAAADGRWQLWPDGSVELTVEAPGRLLRERIWFTQPNLRLRSSVEHLQDGLPGRARFSSEIRRVRKPAA